MKCRCKNCQSSWFSHYLYVDGYNYKRCRKCSLVQLVPMPSDEELNEFYSKNYYSKNYDSSDLVRANVMFNHAHVQYDILKQNYKCDNKTSFLDFGCGTGGFLDVLNENGHSFIFGHEFNDAAIDIILKKGHQHINDLKTNNETFDVISLWDVAEHLTDPISTFTMLLNKLNENGVLVIGTARIDDFVDRTSFGYTMWADVPGHTLLYSRKSLKKILKKSGFSIVRVEKKHGISNIYNSKTAMLKRLLKRILFFRRTDRINKQDTFGSYLVMVAKK